MQSFIKFKYITSNFSASVCKQKYDIEFKSGLQSGWNTEYMANLYCWNTGTFASCPKDWMGVLIVETEGGGKMHERHDWSLAE